MADRVGQTRQTWQDWDIIRKIGEGSFGGVYEIRRTLPGGEVEYAALKRLSVPRNRAEIMELVSQQYDSASITAHFKEQMQDLVREYSFMQKLGNNPNVVHCQDMKVVQKRDNFGWDLFIRMELLTPLKEYLKKDYIFEEEQVIQLGLDMCNALLSCHERNIIHRDIKPENIMVDETGRFKLGDFGIAKISDKTATGTLTGTYGYMAPEIFNHQHYGTSADIYSLGLVMYWMMNERALPFLPLYPQIPSAAQRQEAQEKRFSGVTLPRPTHGSNNLIRIVMKACAFYPNERYHSVNELALDLQRLSEGKRIEDTVVSVRGHKKKHTSSAKKWWKPTIIAIAAVALIGSAVFTGIAWLHSRNNEQTDGIASEYPDEKWDSIIRESKVPEYLQGEWCCITSAEDLDSLSSKNVNLTITADGLIDYGTDLQYVEIKDDKIIEAGLGRTEEGVLYSTSWAETYTIERYGELVVLRDKSLAYVQKSAKPAIKTVELTKENIWDYFELCTAKSSKVDSFGELTGEYSISIYLKPKPPAGYAFWGEKHSNSIAIEVTIPKHERFWAYNNESRIYNQTEEETTETVSFYPYMVADIIRVTGNLIDVNRLTAESDFEVSRAKGTILLLDELYLQGWEKDETGTSLRGRDVFGGIAYMGSWIDGIAPQTENKDYSAIEIENLINEKLEQLNAELPQGQTTITEMTLPGYRSSVNGEWAAEKVQINQSNVGLFVLEEPLTLCKELTVAIDVELYAGASCNDWIVWGRINGSMQEIGRINLPDGKGMGFEIISLPQARTIDAIAVTPTKAGSFSWSMQIGVADIYLEE